jgi:hypothetical protein
VRCLQADTESPVLQRATAAFEERDTRAPTLLSASAAAQPAMLPPTTATRLDVIRRETADIFDTAESMTIFSTPGKCPFVLVFRVIASHRRINHESNCLTYKQPSSVPTLFTISVERCVE